MDEMVAMHRECSIEEVQSMADGDYTKALRETIWSDVFGFFA